MPGEGACRRVLRRLEVLSRVVVEADHVAGSLGRGPARMVRLGVHREQEGAGVGDPLLAVHHRVVQGPLELGLVDQVFQRTGRSDGGEEEQLLLPLVEGPIRR